MVCWGSQGSSWGRCSQTMSQKDPAQHPPRLRRTLALLWTLGGVGQPGPEAQNPGSPSEHISLASPCPGLSWRLPWNGQWGRNMRVWEVDGSPLPRVQPWPRPGCWSSAPVPRTCAGNRACVPRSSPQPRGRVCIWTHRPAGLGPGNRCRGDGLCRRGCSSQQEWGSC